MSVDQAASTTLAQIVQRIDEISTLPHVAMKVMDVANDPESGAADLKEAMECDPALCARVLRCVNSAAYALREKITNLQHAIAYLGLKQVRNLALTAAVSELFKGNEQIATYRRSDLWRHLVATGICARMIALRLGFRNFEDMFLAGLLHDFGLVLEDQHAHLSFRKVMHALEEGKPLAAVEQALLGFDHTVLGEKVAGLWHFPEAVKNAARYHHASVNYRGEHVDVVRCVEVANLICTAKGITSVGMKLVAFSRPAFEGLSLKRDDVLVLAESLDEELEKSAGLFDI